MCLSFLQVVCLMFVLPLSTAKTITSTNYRPILRCHRDDQDELSICISTQEQRLSFPHINPRLLMVRAFFFWILFKEGNVTHRSLSLIYEILVTIVLLTPYSLSST
ncbi:hypothetical protein BGZ63DRAFT_216961 [Mariannaea sp. PMI_226]|nr:hypothetical protein BGZ63DRAFT_216961 [Mariannaea sp. PMI_226]